MDKFGTAGIFLTALFSPCCFPVFAFAASALGLGSFELFGSWTMWVFQAMVLLSIGGLYISYRKHRCMYPLLTAIPSTLLVFYGYHFDNGDNWAHFIYVGMFGLLAATIWNYRRNKVHGTCTINNGHAVLLQSTITCPTCGHRKVEEMPTNSCQFFYQCENCNTVLKPKQGDCCVYCSYGTVPCPPIQENKNCC